MAIEKAMESITHSLRRDAAGVLARAFLDDPGIRAFFQAMPAEEQVRRLSLAYQAELAVCVRRGTPVGLREAGALTAVAVIWPPGTYPVPALEQIEMVVRTLACQSPLPSGHLATMDRRHPKAASQGAPLLSRVAWCGTGLPGTGHGIDPAAIPDRSGRCSPGGLLPGD